MRATSAASLCRMSSAGKWKLITGFYNSDRSVIEPLILADSEQYAKENNITPRDCK